MKTKISQIIIALLEIQNKGYFNIAFDYENSLFQVRIYKGKTDEYPMYQACIDLTTDVESKLDEAFTIVEVLKTMPTKDTNSVMITYFQCYSREFVPGEKSGEWIKIPPVIEYAGNATQLMLIDGSGYYIDDPYNGMQYFVDYKYKSRKKEFNS
jgi:hypothetical protein